MNSTRQAFRQFLGGGSVFIYLLTGNLVLSLILGALAPASAPAGTVAVIDETKSKGKLTNTLYSVVGIDDATAIIIFGITSPVAVFLLSYSGNDIAINKSFIGFYNHYGNQRGF